MTYAFDLDGCLCTRGRNYSDAKPYMERIQRIKELFEYGHAILIEATRGFKTRIDWNEVTRRQIHSWGVRYHELRVGIKFEADVFVDDRTVNSNDFFCKRQGLFTKTFSRIFV